MNATMTSSEVETIEEVALTELAAMALAGLGLDRRDAEDSARILVLGEMFGVTTHGVGRIESYAERLEIGGIAARPKITAETVAPAISRIDGKNGLGPLVGQRALTEAMRIAREHGIGIVFVRGSNHFGPIAPYNFIAAGSGFASMIGSNATTTIAPWGGREARLGNSPLGFGFPNPQGDPVILDMAMSVVARAKIRNAAKAGAGIPPTWATDRDGRPTTDPKEALKGFLLPVGGHKGYGLALVVDLLAGVLSGAAFLSHVKSWVDNPDQPQDLGHFFMLIDCARLGSDAWLKTRMEEFARILHETPPVDEKAPVLLPGEREMQHFHRQRREGITVERKLLDNLRCFAGRAVQAVNT